MRNAHRLASSLTSCGSDWSAAILCATSRQTSDDLIQIYFTPF